MIINTYISSEGHRGICKEKKSSKKQKDTSILKVFLSMADMFIWSLSYMKQTFILRECDVIADSLSDWSAPRVKQDCPSNPLHMNWGGEKKMFV